MKLDELKSKGKLISQADYYGVRCYTNWDGETEEVIEFIEYWEIDNLQYRVIYEFTGEEVEEVNNDWSYLKWNEEHIAEISEI